MSSKRSFIDSASKLFIVLKQINIDTFYRHLFIIAERRYPVTLYEQLVIELTNRSFSLQAAYRSGGTPYELSDREPEPYDQQIKDFARMIEEADCVLAGGASGLSAAGGGDFYYEDNATYRRYFGKFAERYGFKGAFEGSFYRWPTAEARWGYLATFLDTTLNAPLHKPYKDLDAILAEKDFFVFTTNQDTQFVKLYPWERVAEIQGDHRFFQCSRCCTDEMWDAVEEGPEPRQRARRGVLRHAQVRLLRGQGLDRRAVRRVLPPARRIYRVVQGRQAQEGPRMKNHQGVSRGEGLCGIAPGHGPEKRPRSRTNPISVHV